MPTAARTRTPLSLLRLPTLVFACGLVAGATVASADGPVPRVPEAAVTSDAPTPRAESRAPDATRAKIVAPLPPVAPAPPAPAPPAPAPPAPAPPAPAPADAAEHCSGPGWEERRGRAALASLRHEGSSGFRVRFLPARRGFLGLTLLDQRRIDVYVRSCPVLSDARLRHVVAHELGHAYDAAHLSGARRMAWKRERGIPAGTPWYGCSHCTDFATPAGDFAEVYAQWARGASTNSSRLAGDPDPQQLQALAARFFGG